MPIASSLIPGMSAPKMYRLVGTDGVEALSASPGTLGGTEGLGCTAQLDCPCALRWIAKGRYVRHRVFFADEVTAIAAGYRPCAHCLSERHRSWKAGPASSS